MMKLWFQVRCSFNPIRYFAIVIIANNLNNDNILYMKFYFLRAIAVIADMFYNDDI